MKIILLILLSISLYAINIVGTWKLTNNKHPFKCCSLVAYGIKLQFTSHNTILFKNNSMTKTTHRYNLEEDLLNVYLDNTRIGSIPNFLLHNSSANQTFTLHRINKNCFKAIDTNNINNSFTMCKTEH